LKNRKLALALLALLSFAAYAPTLSLPLFEDDYPLISFADRAGFTGVLADPVFRPRVTLSWTLLALWRTVHLKPIVYHAASLALHFANVCLVYLLFLLWPSLAVRRAAFWTAAFFAVAEGHQEAVIWLAAMSELWQFFFGAAALCCFLYAQRASRPWPAVAMGALLFAFALLSKESAVIWLPLFALAVGIGHWRKTLPLLLPFLSLGVVSVVVFALTGSNSFHYTDGSFSLHAPFVLTWSRNFGRVLWIWGLVALIVLRGHLRVSIPGLLWIGISLIPYCFLTYSRQIPSRQTYLASAGLALLVGLAFNQIVSIQRQVYGRKVVAAAVAALVLAHNFAILWFRKRAQFVERAAPTEQIIQLARRTQNPILVRCYGRPEIILSEAVHLATGRPPSDVLFSEAEAAGRPSPVDFCYDATSR
jgi:hypothetical protein